MMHYKSSPYDDDIKLECMKLKGVIKDQREGFGLVDNRFFISVDDVATFAYIYEPMILRALARSLLKVADDMDKKEFEAGEKADAELAKIVDG